MCKLPRHVILYAILMILVVMNMSSTVKIAPLTPTVKAPLEQLSTPILIIILKYLEIHTGFNFICQTTKFYATLRRPLTEVAYAHYYLFLMITIPMSPTTLLPRYYRFLRTPLDPIVPFPDLKLIFLPGAISFLLQASANPETAINDMVLAMSDYECIEIDQMMMYKIKENNKSCWLPLSYDPVQAILRLYSGNIREPDRFHQYVRLPFLLVFTDGGTTTRTEHIAMWIGIEWQIHTSEMVSIITWISHEWILKTLITIDGVMLEINVRGPNMVHVGTFRTLDEGQSYTVFNTDLLASEVKYTSIQAFYYPTTPQFTKETDIKQPTKKYSCHCCNIV